MFGDLGGDRNKLELWRWNTHNAEPLSEEEFDFYYIFPNWLFLDSANKY